MTAEKCTKKRDARAKLLFCQSINLLFFAVLVAVTVVVAYNKLPNVFTDNQSVKYNSPNLLHQDQDIKT